MLVEQVGAEQAFAELESRACTLNRKWLNILNLLNYTFQPIINIHTGVCYGYEAALQNDIDGGFFGVNELSGCVWQEQVLDLPETVLWEKALEQFLETPHHNSVKLFLTVTPHFFDMLSCWPQKLNHLLARYHIAPHTCCLQVSEQQDVHFSETMLAQFCAYQNSGFTIALDDFGVHFSGFQFIYHAEPNFIKIHPPLLHDSLSHSKKKFLLSSLINIAHLSAMKVIAKGVATELDFYTCKELGCDLIQGDFVQAPTSEMTQLALQYNHIHELNHKDRRKNPSDKTLIHANLEYIPPILHDRDILDIFDIFRQNKDKSFFPVIHQNGEPLGIIHENHLKNYTYSRYGKDLLRNPSSRKTIQDFITTIPITDLNTPVEKILEIFSLNEHIEGILIVENMKYAGFLSAHSLLKVLNEKNLENARDQNPLSKLPGNRQIYEYVSHALAEQQANHVFIYFDFDHFKPFNDTYGFRQGDRVILLFSELLNKYGTIGRQFIGHIGGDDFFMAYENTPLTEVNQHVVQLVQQFQHEAESFYSPEDIRKGYIVAKDREGRRRQFPLLTVSAVMLEIPQKHSEITLDKISHLLGQAKKKAKTSPEKIHLITL